jgi:hypothetical protein
LARKFDEFDVWQQREALADSLVVGGYLDCFFEPSNMAEVGDAQDFVAQLDEMTLQKDAMFSIIKKYDCERCRRAPAIAIAFQHPHL